MKDKAVSGRDKPLHIGVKEALPPVAFIMGDPGRVEALLASSGGRLLTKRRGYYIGLSPVGDSEIVIASHGIGGPSLLVLVEELRMLGVRKFVRLGTTGAFAPQLRVGDIVVASGACMLPGTCGLSLYYDIVPPPAAASPVLLSRVLGLLRSSGLKVVVAPVFCSDSFYAESWRIFEDARRSGCVSVDMETGALYAISSIRGLESVSVLVVSNVIRRDGEETADSQLLAERFEKLYRSLAALGLED